MSVNKLLAHIHFYNSGSFNIMSVFTHTLKQIQKNGIQTAQTKTIFIIPAQRPKKNELKRLNESRDSYICYAVQLSAWSCTSLGSCSWQLWAHFKGTVAKIKAAVKYSVAVSFRKIRFKIKLREFCPDTTGPLPRPYLTGKVNGNRIRVLFYFKIKLEKRRRWQLVYMYFINSKSKKMGVCDVCLLSCNIQDIPRKLLQEELIEITF